MTNPNTLFDYLDDDNILHPYLNKLLDNMENDKIHRFNQCNRIKGNNINIGYIEQQWLFNHLIYAKVYNGN